MPKTLAGWGYVYRVDDGSLVSEGTVIAEPLPAGLALLEVPGRHDPDAEQWDPATRRIVPWTNTEKAQEMAARAADLLARAQVLDPAVTLP